jgi:IPT/TIG domain
MPKRITLCALILLALCAFFAVDKAKAQTVWGISGFDYDQTSRQLYGYHATELDYYAWLYYDAYVEGFIYNRFGSELDYDDDLDTTGLAEAFTQTGYAPGETYYVISDHYVGAYYYQEAPGGGGIQYWNPFGFGFSGPSGGYGGLFGFSPGPEVFTYYQLYYLGWTGWEIIFAGEPHIDQMVPTSAPLGISIEVNFNGTNFGVSPSINVGGSGVTVESISFSTDTRITAIFRIADNASVGNHSVSVSSNGYISNSVNLFVGDRTPQINSINPSSGDAGQAVPVTISGLGFGSAPTVNVTGGIGVSITSRNDTQINANFSIPSNATPGAHQVTVTSNGVGGSGFTSGGGSSGTSNPVNFTVNALAAPRIINYSPQSAPLGSNIEINITGQNFGTNRTVQISGQGVTVTGYTAVSDPDHQIVASVSIAENAQPGNRSITVVAGGLTSNAVNFQVGDRTPQITGINPGSGVKGTTPNVVLTGKGFGTNPTLQISGTGVNIIIDSATDTQINARFAISGIAEELPRTVTLTSRGVSGNGFMQTQGTSPNATANFGIDSARVKINSADKRFAPSAERLNVTYTITPPNFNAPNAKLEIFKKGDSTNPLFQDTSIPTTGSNVPYVQNGTPGWDGKANRGQDSDKFVGPGEYTVRVTIGTDSNFSGVTQTAFQDFKIEFHSLETTPSFKSNYNMVKPAPSPTPPTEIPTEIKATVKLKNKAGDGVATAVPFKLHWSFTDPDDTASGTVVDQNGDGNANGNDNAPIAKNGKRGTGSTMWKAVNGTTTNVDQAGQTAISDVIVASGSDMGTAKIVFLSSVIAGDNYKLKLEIKTTGGSVVKTEEFERWSVRKRLEFSNLYKLKNGVDVKSVASEANVDPAFSGTGYTDYIAGTTTNVPEANSPEFIGQLLSPTPSTDPNPELPTQQQLTNYQSTNITVKATAKAEIEIRARRWYERNYATFGAAMISYAQGLSAPDFSIIGARYPHPKLDGRSSSGGTNHYPAGIEIIGVDNDLHDPDGDWGEMHGGKIQNWAYIFLNSRPEERRIIAARHEVGHASDHWPFGPGDHAAAGLMHPAADPSLPDYPYGNPEFDEESILRLRGWKRP